MPTYACAAAVGRLTPAQKLEIVQSITAIHHEETGAPRYLVQVIFYDIGPGNHYIGGQLAPVGQIWIRGDIRDGRTVEQKSRVLSRILQEVSRTGAASVSRRTPAENAGIDRRSADGWPISSDAQDAQRELSINNELARAVEPVPAHMIALVVEAIANTLSVVMSASWPSTRFGLGARA
jgi:phenylpyruvate tautomerase PptA (4-oxalocrotonate tautomerase family)